MTNGCHGKENMGNSSLGHQRESIVSWQWQSKQDWSALIIWRMIKTQWELSKLMYYVFMKKAW